jgi:glyoxylate reductase
MASSSAKPLVGMNCAMHPVIQAEVEAHFDVVIHPTFDFTDDQRSTMRGLLCHGHAKITGALLDRFHHLLVVSTVSVGCDHIDMEAASSRGVVVGNTPDVLTRCTADMAWALLLATARRVVEGDAISRAPGTTTFAPPPFFYGAEVSGATLGVVGLGRIGAAIARRGRGFDMPLLYHNRTRLSLEAEAEAGGATYCSSLQELLQRSDFVVLAVPSSPATRSLMGVDQFRAMKKGAIFVNIGRGNLVDQAALTDALVEGRIWGAGLDVTDPEPLPREHPLLAAPNCTISPHTGSATLATRTAMARLAVDNLKAGLLGRVDLPSTPNGPAVAAVRAGGGHLNV